MSSPLTRAAPDLTHAVLRRPGHPRLTAAVSRRHIAALAKDALVFERAYCQQAVCGPSRNSFLSGRRPDTTKVYTFANSFRDAGPDWTSMLGFFKSKGYTVAGQGKIYHPHSPLNDDGALSWSPAFLPYPEWSQGGDPCPGDPEDSYDPVFETYDRNRSPQKDQKRRLDETPSPSDPCNGPACPVPEVSFISK